MRATMKYRILGKTGLMVSEIGFGGEWLERHPEEEGVELSAMHPQKESIFWTVGCRIQNPETLSEKESRRIVVNGLFKDILVLHGRMDSITGQERWSMYVRHSKIC